MHRNVAFTLSILALTAALGATKGAEAKSLYWQDLSVEARLDADGALHVSERQTMVFTGDWNGGQRVFRIGPGQELELHRISRLDPSSGELRPLTRGDLDLVDHWDWTSSRTVRWRSRRPSDPQFSDTRITYVLDYTLTGILRRQGERFEMAHDFVFPEREGRIERFRLDFEADPVWRTFEEPPPCCDLAGLPPGSGVVVERSFLRAAEAAPPAHVARTVPDAVRYALFAASLAAMATLFARLWSGERRRGRFDTPTLPAPLDREWLEAHVFDLPAEVVGALWDEEVGPPEVAAVLARMELEGKLASRVEPRSSRLRADTLRLELLARLSELEGHERKLIKKLFFGGRTVTDTAAIRKHYRQQGFSPVATIKPALEAKVRQIIRAGGEAPPKPSARPTLWLFAAVGAALVGTAFSNVAGAAALFFIVCCPTAVPGILGLVLARRWRQRVRRLGLAALGFVLPALVIFGVCFAATGLFEIALDDAPVRLGLLPLLALAILPIAYLSGFLHLARTRQGRDVLHKRQLLGAAREELARQLGSERPELEDAWLPYLLAFGLHRRVDRWWKSFGGKAAGTTIAARHSGSGNAWSGGGWSGGGGSFGGAGATASWGVAAAGLAAGVAAPSSAGSGGGGGGGGGGSSGGGGGGGW